MRVLETRLPRKAMFKSITNDCTPLSSSGISKVIGTLSWLCVIRCGSRECYVDLNLQAPQVFNKRDRECFWSEFVIQVSCRSIEKQCSASIEMDRTTS